MKVNGVEIAKRWAWWYAIPCSLTNKLAKDLKQLIEELSQAEAQIVKLRVKPVDVPVACSYCGADICKKKDWDPEIPKHMAACEKNPLAMFLKEESELRGGLVSIKTQLDALTEWKRQQLQVESTWNPQEVASALNLPIGSDIRKEILPSIKVLQEEIARLTELVKRLTADTE